MFGSMCLDPSRKHVFGSIFTGIYIWVYSVTDYSHGKVCHGVMRLVVETCVKVYSHGNMFWGL